MLILVISISKLPLIVTDVVAMLVLRMLSIAHVLLRLKLLSKLEEQLSALDRGALSIEGCDRTLQAKRREENTRSVSE